MTAIELESLLAITEALDCGARLLNTVYKDMAGRYGQDAAKALCGALYFIDEKIEDLSDYLDNCKEVSGIG